MLVAVVQVAVGFVVVDVVFHRQSKNDHRIILLTDRLPPTPSLTMAPLPLLPRLASPNP